MASPKIAVVYYSMYGHIRTLAETMAKAIKEGGAQVDIYQVQETLPQEVLAKMHAPEKADYPVISADKLTEYDGFAFGFPTRYGRAVAQFSQFLDTTGGLWAKGALTGKFATCFTSTSSQHATIPFFVHHGINVCFYRNSVYPDTAQFVPAGYGASQLQDNSELVGGSAYGAAAIAGGDGSRAVSDKENEIAIYQDVKTVGAYVKGKSA